MHESIVFCSGCTMSSLRKFTFAISSPDEFLFSDATVTSRNSNHANADSGCGSLRNLLKVI